MIRSVNNTITSIKLAREASYVRRCHTSMHIGEYNVGFHTFNMALMLRMLYPDCRKELIWAILEHDIPERLTGDIPSPAKWAGVVNRAALEQLEGEILTWLMEENHASKLTEQERYWLLGLDLLELFFWCKDQMALGNVHIVTIHKVLKRVFQSMMSKLPSEILRAVAESERTQWVQMEDLSS